jgi:hypothetical protein
MMSGGEGGREGGWGQKVLSKPSADSFAVGRRQKALKSFLHSLTICDKLASGNKKTGKRLFGKHQFMVTVRPLAVATVSDGYRVFELLIPNSTNSDIQYKRNDHIGEADLLIN